MVVEPDCSAAFTVSLRWGVGRGRPVEFVAGGPFGVDLAGVVGVVDGVVG
jgi:hypothetical protein